MSNESINNPLHFTVEEPVETIHKELTVRQILGLATIDADTHYLLEIGEATQKKYANLDEVVPIHEGAKFIAVFTGPTPIS